jgi:hypothetical protein
LNVFSTEGQAKRFFVERIVAQASFEQLPLSDAERRMLSWSESDPEYKVDVSLPAQLQAEMSDEDYEAKIGGLVQRAYERDAAGDSGASQRYKDAHSVLKQGDHYLLIMIEQGLRQYLRPWWKFSWT